MKKFACMLLLLCTLQIFGETDRGAVLRFQTSKFFDYNKQGVSFLADLGEGNWRGNLTYAKQLKKDARIKATGEYLYQKHNFCFTPGNIKSSVGQAAFGVTAEQLLYSHLFKLLYLNVNYSTCNGKKLSTVEFNGVNYDQRIRGGDGYQVRLGTSLNTPNCGYLKLFGGYQNLNYRKNNDGFDCGAFLYQPLTNQFALNLEVESNKAYDFYRSSIDWAKNSWKIGAFSSYVNGKRGLNNDFRYGAELSIALGGVFPSSCSGARTNQNFESFAALPAVLKPVTLAIASQSSHALSPPGPVCLPPVLLNASPPAIDPIAPTCPGFFNYDTSVLFSGDNITYSANLPAGIFIDSTTGVITGSSLGPPVNTTVTAENECGSVSVVIPFNLYDC